MKTFNEDRNDVQRVCSEYAAGRTQVGEFEAFACEVIRQRVDCGATSLWRRIGDPEDGALTLVARATNGDGAPAPASSSVPMSRLQEYFRWLHGEGKLNHCSKPPKSEVGKVLAQAAMLQGVDAPSFLHLPIRINGTLRGVIALHDAKKHVRCTNATRRELRQLAALVTTYLFSPGGRESPAGMPIPSGD